MDVTRKIGHMTHLRQSRISKKRIIDKNTEFPLMPCRDFTLDVYSLLISKISDRTFYCFREFCTTPTTLSIILRQDIDTLPQQALRFAQLQCNMGIQGIYYFRIVPESFQPLIIEQIAKLGHEIGYHYEDLTLVAETRENEKRKKKYEDSELADLLEQGIESFAKNLATMRQYADIKTICMHGSPLSKWDSRLLWSKYDYRDFGIVGEPYFDIDFTKVAYYTDTGRRWDGDKVSLRDKIMDAETQAIAAAKFPRFHSTFDIINAANSDELPEQIMFTFHPQRWHDRWWPWTKELVGQNVKNIAKHGINVWNDRSTKRSRSGC